MSMSLYGQLLTRLEAELVILPDKPDETPRNTLDCLWAMASGQAKVIDQLTGTEPVELEQTAKAMLNELVTLRLSGVPLAHLTGRQKFMGVILKTSSAALIPRRETELLGWAALEHINKSEAPAPLVVDLCTGCGNLALALATHAPKAKVWGSDLSEDAVALARENAEFLGRPDVKFFSGDLAKAFDNEAFLGRVDVLTCNPPYISSSKVETMHREISAHEPELAFDGGPFGVMILQRLIKDAPRLLKHGGWLLFEVGLGQGMALKKRLERTSAFDEVVSHTDRANDIRVLAARRGTDSGEG